MNEYKQRLDALFQLEFFGMKLGLDNIRALLDVLGYPERSVPSIHIAGTNGKGSVAAMLAAVHQTAGRRTGLYTSPHLVDFRERIRIDGAMISEDEVAHFLERIWPTVEELRATFFEVTTAMAFDHFARHHVDSAIIETGLGGRLDATNVLDQPLATVVTSIGYDHMAQLGNSLEEIASEKAGIFKRGVPAVVNCPRAIEHVFRNKAKEVEAPLTLVREFIVPPEFEAIHPAFAGEHQKVNVRTVLATVCVLPYALPSIAIGEGISNAARLTGLRGRLEEFRIPDFAGRVFLDVGHNPEALEAVRTFFVGAGIRPVVIFGIMKDKDVRAALEIISGFASRVIAVQAKTLRAMPSAELATIASEFQMDTVDGHTVEEGLKKAMEMGRSVDDRSSSEDTILVSGSHYVVGEFLQNFNRGPEVNMVAATKPKLRNPERIR